MSSALRINWHSARRISVWAAVAVMLLAVMISAFPGRTLAAACTDGEVEALRAAVTASNETAGIQTITLAACEYNLGAVPLELTDGAVIRGAGSGPDGSILTAAGNRILIINEGMSDSFPDVTLEALAVKGGKAPDHDYGGGGIFADTGRGTLTLRDVVVEGNQAGEGGSGAGLYVSGPAGGKLILDDVVVRGNNAAVHGAGLYLDGDLDLTVSRTLFQGNVAVSGTGGGIAFLPGTNTGTVRIEDSTFTANRANGEKPPGGYSFTGTGGGLSIGVRNTTIVNSTFSGNFARDGGGGIMAAADQPEGVTMRPKLIHLTITGNESTAQPGAGLYIAAGKPQLKSSIVSGNRAPSFPEKKDIAAGANIVIPLEAPNIQYNIIGSASEIFALDPSTQAPVTGTNRIHADPRLQPLSDNGGYTPTHALAADSPARSAGGPVSVEAERDQRGFPRLLNAQTAAGAVEGLSAQVMYDGEYTATLNLRGAADLTAERRNEAPAGLIASDLPLTGSGETRVIKVTPSGDRAGTVSYRFTAPVQVNGAAASVASTLELEVVAFPDLKTDISYSGIFYQGQNTEYGVTITNVGAASTTADIMLAISGHSAYTITNISGSDWTCGAASCTRTKPIGVGESAEVTVRLAIHDQASGNAVFQAEAQTADEPNTANNAASASVPVLPVPRIDGVAVPAAGLYKAGDALTFTVHYDRGVNVEGQPYLALQIGSSERRAYYTGGSGGESLTFGYEVENGLEDHDGISVTSLVLNGGTLSSAAGAPARLTLAGVGATDGIRVDGKAPAVAEITLPAAGAYPSGAALQFGVRFDEPVEVTGQPSLALDVGGVIVQAVYNSVNSHTLLFTYTVQAGHNDADGIGIGSLYLNGGTIRDAAGNDAIMTIPPGTDASGIIIDSAPPEATGLYADTAAGMYNAGDLIRLRAVLSEAVEVQGQPRIAITVGEELRFAQWTGGSGTAELIFEYAIQPGDADPDGILFASADPLELNGGTVRDAAGNNALLTFAALPDLSGILVDTVPPSIVSVTMEEKTYLAGDAVELLVTFDEAAYVTGGTPMLAVTIGGTAYEAGYASGSGANALLFRLDLPDGIEHDGIVTLGSELQLNGSAIADAAGNAANRQLPPPLERNAKVDTLKPAIVSVSAAPGAYREGDALAFLVKYNEAVQVTGTPELAFRIGGTEYAARYNSGNGTDTLGFVYTVLAGDADGQSVDLSGVPALSLNGAFIRDASGNEAVNELTGVGDMSQVIVDSTAPVIESLTSDNPAGVYKTGDTLRFRASLSEEVRTNAAADQLVLPLLIGAAEKRALYEAADSSGTELVFVYTVAEGDFDADGIATGAELKLEGAAVEDLNGNSLNLSLPAGTLPDLKVDGVAPSIVEVEVPEAGAYRSGQSLEFVLSLSEPVTINMSGGIPSLELDIGGITVQAVYNGNEEHSDRLSFSYTIADGNAAEDGIALFGELRLNGAVIVDASDNPLPLTLPTAQPYETLDGVTVDTTAPAAPVFTTADGAVFYTTSPVIAGTAEPGSTVRVTAAGSSMTGMASAGPDGKWSVTLTGLARGDVELAANTTDRAGNVSPDSSLSITITSGGGGGTVIPPTNVLELALDDSRVTVVLRPDEIAAGRVRLDMTDYSDLLLKLSPETMQELLRLNGGLVLEIETKRGSFAVPVAAVKAAAESEAKAALRSLELDFSADDGEAATGIRAGLARLGADAVSEPIELAVRYEDVQGNAGQLKKLGGEAPLRLKLGTANPDNGSVAARWNEETGKLEFVPATFVRSNGEWVAEFDGSRLDSYAVIHYQAEFADVNDHWSKTEVELLASMLVIEGRDRDTFDPNGTITRAEFTALVSRLLGLDPSGGTSAFGDVKGRWYEGAVAAAADAGIVSGYGSGEFRPDATISRQEMAVMLLRAIRYIGASEAGGSGQGNPFADQESVGAWALEAVRTAAGLGIVQGDQTGSFRPAAMATRAEAAVMLLRLMRATDLTEW